MTHTATPSWRRRVGTAAVAVTLTGVLLESPAATAPPGVSTTGPTLATTPATTPAGSAASAGTVALVSAAQRHRRPTPPGRRMVLHRVRPGDTATGLAVRYHAWTAELRAVNHLGRSSRLLVGQLVRVPVVVAAQRRARPRAVPRPRPRAGSRVHRSAHRARPWRQADASRAQVRRMVRRIARRHGVDPRLALAISWQESGWQQRRRSSAGAIGAMQVLPSTGRWMALYVGRPLNLYGLHDNITAGVVLFTVLRRQTGWRRSIAAYYQGLGALREHGVYPSSRRYVRNVVALHLRLRHGWDPA